MNSSLSLNQSNLQQIANGNKSSIYLYRSSETSKPLVLKCVENTHIEQIKNLINEYNNLIIFNSPHVLKVYEYKKDVMIKNNQCSILISQYASRASLFQLIQDLSFKWNMKMIRSVFKQMALGLEEVHKKNKCHLDIQPQNFLVMEDFQIKISDFGFTAEGESAENVRKFIGTRKGYMAPEIFLTGKEIWENEYFASSKPVTPFNGFQADIFSLGSCLYVLAFQKVPFLQAIPNDCFFQHLLNDDWKTFWNYQQGKLDQLELNEASLVEQFQTLIEAMLNPNPKERPTINQILEEFEWMQGPIEEDLCQLFKENTKSYQY